MLLFTAIIVFLVVLISRNELLEEDSVQYEDEINVLNVNFPSDIIVYGEEVGFDSKLKYREITDITEENLTSDSKYKYTFLVINDREGKLDITEEDLALCKKMCEKKDMNFFYIGEKQLENLKTAGFYSLSSSDDVMGIGYVISPTGNVSVQGFWSSIEEEHSKKNSGLLGQILVYEFVDDVIKMMN